MRRAQLTEAFIAKNARKNLKVKGGDQPAKARRTAKAAPRAKAAVTE